MLIIRSSVIDDYYRFVFEKNPYGDSLVVTNAAGNRMEFAPSDLKVLKELLSN